MHDSRSGVGDGQRPDRRDWRQHEPVSGCRALGELGGPLSGKLRERGQAEEREDAERECLAAALPMPSGLGRLNEENNYLSALYRRLAVRRGSKRATIAVAHNLLGHRLLHSTRPDLLPRPGTRLLRSPEPRRLAPPLNQKVGRFGLQSDRRALSPSRLEAIF